MRAVLCVLLAASLLPGAAFAATPASTSPSAPSLTASAPSAEYRGLVVRPRTGASQADLAALFVDVGATTVDRSEFTDLYLLQMPTGTEQDAFGQLAASPLVQKCEYNYLVRAAAVTNDPLLGSLWGLEKVDAPAAWPTATGSDVVVAVLDTGVSSSHPDLEGQLVPGWDFVNGDQFAEDDHGHGTHVAGTIAAVADNSIGVAGVAPNAKIMPVKVLGSSGYGYYFWIAEGIRWAAANGASVINLSLGGSQYVEFLQDAVNFARAKDTAVMAAMMNNAESGLAYPAALNGVIAVGATEANDTLASFSNYGPWVDVSAPGVGVLSTAMSGGYEYKSGTSMATPHVAGIAALVRSANPDLSAEAVEHALKAGSVDLGAPGFDNLYGHGRVDAPGALAAAVTPEPGTAMIGGAVRGGGSALAGARITAYRLTDGVWARDASTSSAPDGSYQIAGLAAGSYRLEFSDPAGDFASTYSGGAVSLETATPYTLDEGGSVVDADADLEPAARIEGTVRADGGGLGGILVEAGVTSGMGDWVTFGSAVSAADGTYSVTGLRAGHYTVRFRDTAGTYAVQYFDTSLQALNAAEVALAAGQTQTGVDADLRRGSTVSGWVTGPMAEAVPGALIEVLKPPPFYWYGDGERVASATSDASGYYALGGLAPGTYTVRVVDPLRRYAPSSGESISIRWDENLSLDVGLSQGARITGRVLDGTPAAAAPVRVWRMIYHEDMTDYWTYEYVGQVLTGADGTFAFGGLQAGDYYVEASRPNTDGWGSAEVVIADMGSTVDAGDIEIVRGGVASGKVVDTSGNPLAGMRVSYLKPDDYGDSITDSAGDYRVPLWPEGSFEFDPAIPYFVISASDPLGGHFSADYPGRVFGDEGEVLQGLDITLAPAGRITGTVTDVTGMPLRNVRVSASVPGKWWPDEIASAHTDSFGRYALGPLQLGAYMVSFQDSTGRHLSQWYPGVEDEDSAEPLYLTDNSSFDELDAVLSGTLEISGRVIRDDGAPLPWATVTAWPENGGGPAETWADVNGAYSLRGLVAGDWRVSAMDGSGRFDDAPERLVAAGSSGVELELARKAKLTGIVEDESGQPLIGIGVSAMDPEDPWGWSDVGEVTTDADGRYSLWASSGSYVIKFWDQKQQYTDQYAHGKTTFEEADVIEVTAPEVFPMPTEVLSLSGSVSGVVTSPDGVPVEGASVDVMSADWTLDGGWAETDALGHYTVSGLEAGEYLVRVEAEGYPTEYYLDATNEYEATPVLLARAEQRTGIDVQLDRGARVSGTVRNSTGTPLQWISVSAQEWFESDGEVGVFERARASTGVDGTYVIEGLRPGTYVFYAEDWLESGGSYGRYHPEAREIVDATRIDLLADEERAGVDVTLPALATISGTVTFDPSGEPLGEVGVVVYPDDYDGWGEHRATTASDGTYSVVVPEPGAYEVTFSSGEEWWDYADWPWEGGYHEYLQSRTYQVTLGEGDQYPLDAQLREGADGASITGSVTAEGEGVRAVVEALDPDGDGWSSRAERSTITSADGTYALRGVPTDTDVLVKAKVDSDELWWERYYDNEWSRDNATPVRAPASGIDFTIGDSSGGGDVTPPVTTISGVPGSWTRDPVTITLSSNEPGATYYTVDGFGSTTYWTPFTVTQEGVTTLQAWSRDEYSNIEDPPREATIRIDKTPPAVSDDALPSYDSHAEVTISATDALSGVASVSYSLNGAATVVTAGPTAVVTSGYIGTNIIEYSATDVAGNTANGSASFVIGGEDTTPPITTISVSPSTPDGSNGWYVTTPEVTLNRNEPGTTWYTFGGPFVEYTAPFTVPEGEQGLTYYSVDLAENTEDEKVASFKVDLTDPTVPGGVSAAALGASSIRVSWTAGADAGSGVWRHNVYNAATNELVGTTMGGQLDVGGLSPGTAYSFYVRAQDNAGRESAVSMTATATTGGSVAPPVIPVEGANRWETAAAASELAYPAGADTVVIATGLNWPDALGGTALAGALDAPILLVGNTVPTATAAEIGRLGATHAVIVGGEAAVSASVRTALEGLGLSVDRVFGTNRYKTAEAVAARVIAELGTDYEGTAFIATGANFPDAIAAAPLAAAKGWPLILAHPRDGLTDESKALLQSHVDDALILGGTAVVPQGVATWLAGRGIATTRLAGANRYLTAIAIATYAVDEAGHTWDRIGIATGQNFPDALAGGVLQGRVGSVMTLTPRATLHPDLATLIESKADLIDTVTYFGGTSAVSQAVRDAVSQILQ